MRKTFTTPGSVLLKVRVPAGRIVLETSDGAETVVQLEPYGADEASREAVESAVVEARERTGGQHEITVEVDERRRGGLLFAGPDAEVLLTVRSPHGTNVQLETSSADVDASGRFGDVELSSASGELAIETIEGRARARTASGELRLGRVAGELRAETASGDVAIGVAEAGATVSAASGDVFVERLLGPGSVKLASGDITVRELDASLEASTASGDQRIEAVSAGVLNLESASGDIAVGVRRGSRLSVDAASRSGSTSSEVELSDDPPEDEGPLVELRARSGSGDIRVLRAPARESVRS